MDIRQLVLRLHQVRPSRLIVRHRELAELLRNRLRERVRQRVLVFQTGLERAIARLRLLGPEQVLARGYSITTDAASGAIVRDAAKVKHGQRLKTRLQLGEVTSLVDKEVG
jgi:exodeoxyribonuclease VII large subunit